MPAVWETYKNYVIESEEDIPEKYRKEIEERLNAEESSIQADFPKIISGKKGKTISEEKDIGEIFSDGQELYFGHGTCGGEEVINSIFEIGLKTINPEDAKFYGNTLRGLDSTTIEFGEGTDSLFSEQKDLLNNWPHKGSKDVVIVSIPRKYVLRNKEVGLADLYEPYYVGSKEKGYRLRPEFVKGVYNSDSHSFTLNDNFYQNLEPEEQNKLFEEIKQQYIKSYAEYSNLSPKEVKKPLPLNENELEQLMIEWYKNQLERFRMDKIFEPQKLDKELHEMANGSRISDFNDTIGSIREDAQQEMEEDKENTDEGWLLDGWE